MAPTEGHEDRQLLNTTALWLTIGILGTLVTLTLGLYIHGRILHRREEARKQQEEAKEMQRLTEEDAMHAEYPHLIIGAPTRLSLLNWVGLGESTTSLTSTSRQPSSLLNEGKRKSIDTTDSRFDEIILNAVPTLSLVDPIIPCTGISK